MKPSPPAAQRGSPKGLWPEVKSVIALGMSYAPAHDPLALADHPGRGRISVYAQGGDYHDVVKKALKAVARWLVAEVPGTELKVFVDTAPVMEKPLAAAARIGRQLVAGGLRRRGLAVPSGSRQRPHDVSGEEAGGLPARLRGCCGAGLVGGLPARSFLAG